jgi:hypothetical protein
MESPRVERTRARIQGPEKYKPPPDFRNLGEFLGQAARHGERVRSLSVGEGTELVNEDEEVLRDLQDGKPGAKERFAQIVRRIAEAQFRRLGSIEEDTRSWM